jgi:GH18 family chitinase
MAPLLGSTEEEEVVVVDVVEVSLEEETITTTTTTTTNSPSLSPMDLASSSVAPTLIATTADKTTTTTTTTATTVAAEAAATATTTEATAFVPQTAWAPTTTAATTIPEEVGGANAIIAAASMSSNMVQVFPTDPSGLVISATAIGMKPIFPVTADGATAVVVAGLPQAASAAASVYNDDPKFHKRSSTHHKEIIAYWRSRGKVTTASDINYTKYTRINVAFYIIDATGRIVIGSADAISEGEILFGPKVFEDKGDGESRNYCIQGIHETYCNMHEYKFGMIHLAHTVGTEVYATISLGDVISLATLNVDAFVADAVSVMTVNGYDGLDLDFVMKETDENSSAPEKSAALQDAELLALEGVLSGIRMRINELMVQDERAYGLTLTLPCSTFRTPNIGSVIEFIDELNLRTFDFNTPSTSEVVAPNSPLYSYPDGPIDRSVDSCISDWTTSTESSTESIISRDRINIGLSFNGVVYHGAEALYGSHTTELSTEVDVMMSYHEIFPSLQNNEMSKGWDDVTKSIFGMNTWGELTTFEDVMSICWKTDYGINNDMNGFFVW